MCFDQTYHWQKQLPRSNSKPVGESKVFLLWHLKLAEMLKEKKSLWSIYFDQTYPNLPPDRDTNPLWQKQLPRSNSKPVGQSKVFLVLNQKLLMLSICLIKLMQFCLLTVTQILSGKSNFLEAIANQLTNWSI